MKTLHKNKYKAKKIEVDGEVFDSKAEARRWLQLRKMVDTGEIKNLCRQVEYMLIPRQRDKSTETYRSGPKKGQFKPGKLLEREVMYVCDFQYEKDGKLVVEDVKGYTGGGAYTVFCIKRKLMLMMHGIQVQVVK
jgi:hypothetical protein